MGRDFCQRLIDDIVGTATAHFELEQRQMEEARYPLAGQHADEHAMLIGQLRDFMVEFDAESSGAYTALVHFVEVWLNFHILFSDKKFAEFLSFKRPLTSESAA